MAKNLAKEILNIICCPVDKADLKYDHKKQILTCTNCKKVYKIKDGIPVLLPPELEK